jgi:hypothetical protein
MKSLSLVVDNAELTELYGIINYFMDRCNSERYDYILHSWKRLMEDCYNTRSQHCLVFVDVEINILAKMSSYYLNNGNTDKEKRRICGNILECTNRSYKI